jgi:hypothetical protein
MSDQYPDGFEITHEYSVSVDNDAKMSGATHEVTTTFNFSGVGLRTLAREAIRPLTIKLQGVQRRELTKGIYPRNETVDVSEWLTRKRIVRKITSEDAIAEINRALGAGEMTREEAIEKLIGS